MTIISRGREVIQTLQTLRASEIAQITINTCAHVCAAVSYISTAIFTLLRLFTSSIEATTEAQVQAVVDLADYPALLIELANTLDTRLKGLPNAERETDIVGSLCSKMRLLARCYPHQVRGIIGDALPQSTSQDTPMMELRPNQTTMVPQLWPSIYGELDEILPMDDIHWDDLLNDLTGIN